MVDTVPFCKAAGARIEIPEGGLGVAANSTGAAHWKLSAQFKRPPQGQTAFCATTSVSGRALLAKDSTACDPTPSAEWAPTRDYTKGAVGALLGGLGGTAKKAENGLIVVDKAAWQRMYDQRTKSLRCGGANSRVHECFDGAWQPAPADPAPPKQQDWSETLRGSKHGELKTLYVSGPMAREEDVSFHTPQQTSASEAMDLYNEVSQLYMKPCQKSDVGKVTQPAMPKGKVDCSKGGKQLLLGSEQNGPMCMCGPGRSRLKVLAQEQHALRRCVSAQRVALQQAKNAMALSTGGAADRSRLGRSRTQSARGRNQ